jgi:HNH endonuclease
MKLTQGLVRELLDYHPKLGTLKWKPRARYWFNSDTAHKRWNNRYAKAQAFTYISKGYRWGSIFDTNQLAHRIVWLHVHGKWPKSIAFKDGDATNLKLTNLVERGGGVHPTPRPVRANLVKRQPRERLPLQIAA